MIKLLKEPLLIFLVLGAGIFLVDNLRNTDNGDYLIQVTPGDVKRIQTQWQAQMGQAPTEKELVSLIDEHVREEMYYREAIRLGLDQDDIIIRRRLAQKLIFLAEDVAGIDDPGDEALQRFFEENSANYRKPPRLSFSHIYFSPERRGDSASTEAEQVLAQVNTDDSNWRGLGDPFMLNRAYAERNYREISDLFGQVFTKGMIELGVGPWHGPVKSAYGFHLVRIDKSLPAADAIFARVRERLLKDYQSEQLRLAKTAYDEALRARYQVEQLSN